jgi:hypothetical protein
MAMVDTSRGIQRNAGSGPPIIPQPVPDGAPRLATDKDIAAPLEAVPDLSTDKVFKLSVPVKLPNGQLVKEISCRLPTGMDLFEIGGLPTRTVWTQTGMSVEMDGERLKQWLSRIANWDTVTIYKAPARDVRAMYEWLVGELNPAGN